MKLPRNYYMNQDVTALARDLLGKTLFTRTDGEVCGGIITETEAYEGVTDKASHAWNGRRTKRNEIMFLPGGHAYVYLCYGIHALFNVVTGPENIPHAILVRGIKATFGIETMHLRLGKTRFENGFVNGPGNVTKALGIKVRHTGTDLLCDTIWLENDTSPPGSGMIKTTTRIGIDYAGPDALLPYRFILQL